MKKLTFYLSLVLTILILLLMNNISKAQTSFNISNQTRGDTLLTIDNDGNVGIGTTTPEHSIDVKSSTVDDFSSLRLGNLDGSRYLFIHSGNPTYYPIIRWHEGEPLRFATWTDTYTELMRIAADGNLGIGTTSPGAGIHLVGDGYPNSFMFLQSQTGEDAGFRLYEDATPQWHIYNSSTEGGFWIQNNAWQTAFFADQSTAYIGIGTTAPSQRLHVDGTIYSSSGGIMFPDGSVQSSAVGGGGTAGNSLDQAYDQGGAGAGRIITADAGAVGIAGSGGIWVSGHISGNGGLTLAGSGDEGGQLSLSDGDGQGGWIIDNYGSTDNESFRVFRGSGFNNIFNALVINELGDVGIGTGGPSEKLTVAGTIHSNSGGFRFPDGTTQTTAATGGSTGGNTLDQAYDEGGAGVGRIITADSGPVHITGGDGLVVNANVGIGSTTPDYPLEIYPGTNTRGINIDHNQSGLGTTYALRVDLDKTYVGTSNVYGSEFQVTNNNGSGSTFGLYADATGTSDGFKYGVRGVATGEGWKYGIYGFATGTGNKFGVFGAATGSGTNWAGYFGDGNVHISNRLGIGTLTPSAGLHLHGTGFPSSFMYLSSETGGSAGFRLYEGSIAKWHIFNSYTLDGFHIYNDNGQTVFYADQTTANVGIGTTNPSSKLSVAGTIDCDIITIRGGSDIAEPFDINNTKGIEAGMVMTIDSDNPGKLKISNKAYDRCVAGIISGAGGINPGMIMGQSGTIADGEFPVALTGRVYCRADASNGSIHPGDLLTTSDIPGHAMKVIDYTKAQGSVIGKAMSSLEDGQGLILVLVALQ